MRCPRCLISIASIVLVIVLAGAASVGWATTYPAYIKIGDITGDSTDSAHRGWIDVLSFTVNREMVETCGSAERTDNTTVADVVFTKAIDKSSPKLAEEVDKGEEYPEIELDIVNRGERCRLLLHQVSGLGVAQDGERERVSMTVGHIAFVKGDAD